MNLFDLTGKVCIVTGGNGGIGLAYAKGLLKAGAQVAIWGRSAEKNKTALQALDTLGGTAASFIADLTDEDQAKAAFDATLAHFGKVDICFANAGGAGKQGLFHKWSTEEWQQILDLNLNSVVHTYKLVIKHLIDREAPGKLIVTSSIAALMGTGYAAGYGTTKAAVMGLTRSLAIELGRNGIQVNAILPGFVETEMSVKTPPEFQEGVVRRSASGKMGTLNQLEGVAVFLASSHSDFMTGQGIVLDGGHSIFPM
ncbi:MAG: SDR family NAD(P)-dependent oxidoreductase [Eudoraea sp.]|uniref:SDR family NAD(P)-dependent oxidoreductase n=1 Tax=Eudoraea sp. TaxID=1979955 RepID=UPI003267CCB9